MKDCANCWGYQEYGKKYLSPEKLKQNMEKRQTNSVVYISEFHGAHNGQSENT